jgi:hypothetical protein
LKKIIENTLSYYKRGDDLGFKTVDAAEPPNKRIVPQRLFSTKSAEKILPLICINQQKLKKYLAFNRFSRPVKKHLH